MSLKDIERDLHKRESFYAKREHNKTKYNTEISRKANTGDFTKKNDWRTRLRQFREENYKVFVFGSIVFLVISAMVIVAIAVFVYQRSFFNNTNVSVRIEGPQATGSNENVTYTVTYKNANRAQLHNVEILLRHSENFVLTETDAIKKATRNNSTITLGTVAPREEKQITFDGVFFGMPGHIVALEATMQYTPENSTATFGVTNRFDTKIVAAPVLLDIRGPLDVVDGKTVEYEVYYKNTSLQPLENQRITLHYPAGFTLLEAKPVATQSDHVWDLGTIAPGQEQKIIVQGAMRGITDDVKTFIASVGAIQAQQYQVYDQKEHVLRIARSPLTLRQKVNNREDLAVNAGQSLEYVVTFHNTSNIGLRDIVLSVDIDNPILDYTELSLNGGSFDGATKKITWKAVDVPALANLEPNASGGVRFTIPVTQNLPIVTQDDKNFVVTTVASIDSFDVPTPIFENKVFASNTLAVKVNSKMLLDVKGLYSDPVIANTGPLQPTVGKETTYTMMWAVTNVSNDVRDVRVRSALPTGVVWKNAIVPEQENISYNERTNEVVWDIGRMKNATGVLTDPRHVRFQIGLTPSPDQINKEVPLLEQAVLTAKDLFTEEEMRITHERKTTQLSEDETLASGRVTSAQNN